LHVKVVVEDMDMHTKVKQLGVNMREQMTSVLILFLDFMDSFKLFKTYNMFALMLYPQFEDLNIVKDYVDHSSTIDIANAYDNQFLIPTPKSLYQKLHEWSNVFISVVQKIVHNINVVFYIRMFKDETCLNK